MMKKMFAVMLSMVMLSMMFAINASAMERKYYHCMYVVRDSIGVENYDISNLGLDGWLIWQRNIDRSEDVLYWQDSYEELSGAGAISWHGYYADAIWHVNPNLDKQEYYKFTKKGNVVFVECILEITEY